MENEKRSTLISPNTLFGLVIGLGYIIASYLFYRAGRSLYPNPRLNNALLLPAIAGVFLRVRQYRKETRGGTVSYGQALGVCTYLFSVAAMVYGVYLYFLYRQVPALTDSYLAAMEAVVQEVYKDTALSENIRQLLPALITPLSIALSEIFNKILTGFVFSLFLAGLLRRKNTH